MVQCYVISITEEVPQVRTSQVQLLLHQEGPVKGRSTAATSTASIGMGDATTPDNNTGKGLHTQHGGGGREAVPIGYTGPTANDLHMITRVKVNVKTVHFPTYAYIVIFAFVHHPSPPTHSTGGIGPIPSVMQMVLGD